MKNKHKSRYLRTLKENHCRVPSHNQYQYIFRKSNRLIFNSFLKKLITSIKKQASHYFDAFLLKHKYFAKLKQMCNTFFLNFLNPSKRHAKTHTYTYTHIHVSPLAPPLRRRCHQRSAISACTAPTNKPTTSTVRQAAFIGKWKRV